MFEESSLMMLLIIASLVINLVTMILVIVSLKQNKSRSKMKEQNASVQVAAAKQTNLQAGAGVVFCRNCGNQYDSTIPVCPDCKAPR
jgi:hypothetical protein